MLEAGSPRPAGRWLSSRGRRPGSWCAGSGPPALVLGGWGLDAPKPHPWPLWLWVQGPQRRNSGKPLKPVDFRDFENVRNWEPTVGCFK